MNEPILRGLVCAAIAVLGGTSSLLAASTAAGEEPAAVIALCPAGEPGAELRFSGRVLDYDGRPLAKAAVVAYHADHLGLYNPPDSETRVPRLRGVAVTDAQGRFAFSTIRPGPYPNGSAPAHIHVSVTAPAHQVRHLEYWFEGDPLITPAQRQRVAESSDIVIVELARSGEALSFSHDIRLEGN